MNDLEKKPSSTGASSHGDAVQLQLTILLIGLIVLAGTFAVFVWRQVRYMKADLALLKPIAALHIQGYNQEKPTVDALVARIVEYGRTHPDFEPIMRKYQLQAFTNAPAAPAAAKPAAPVPARPATNPAPAPKK